MQRLIPTCVLLILANLVSAQTLSTIDGTVYHDPYPSKMASLPIAGVKVYLRQQLFVILPAEPQAPVPIDPPVIDAIIDSALTGAGGAFAFKPYPDGSYRLSFAHPAYEPRTIDLYLATDTTLHVTLVSKGARGAVVGSVYAACSDPLGMPCVLAPVAGCTVSVTYAVDYPYPAWYGAAAPVPAQSYFGVTDKSGAYVVDSLPVSYNGQRVVVTASAPGYAAQSIDTAVMNMTNVRVNFMLGPRITGIEDSVTWTPARPTSRDSIAFSLWDALACCCRVYHNVNVFADDTTVTLYFQYDDSPCRFCRCAGQGTWVKFPTRPLAAGTYGIYKSAQIYCPPGTACPAIIALPVRVGQITVTAFPVTVRQAPVSAGASSLTISDQSLTLRIGREQTVTVEAFALNGARDSRLSVTRRLAAGTYLFSLDNRRLQNQVLVIRAVGEDFRQTVKANPAR